VSGCSGGAGVFGIIKDADYKTSYQVHAVQDSNFGTHTLCYSVHTLYLTRRLHVRGGLDRAQFAWPSLLVAGFPAEPACAVRLPCIEQTAAEFCMKYGECPAGQVRPENQTWASTSVVAL
jgi:hypothetical protein